MLSASRGLFVAVLDPAGSLIEPVCEPHRVERVSDVRIGSKRCVVSAIAPKPRYGDPSGPTAWRDLRVVTADQSDSLDQWRDTRDLGVVLARQARTIQLIRPLTATRPLFWTRRRNALLIADDSRWLLEPTFAADPRGVLCLLEMGGLFAPFSPWRGIELLEPGTCLTVDIDTLDTRRSVLEFWDAPASTAERHLSEREQDDILAHTLDATLLKLCPRGDPVILFSGGVDSGVFAARAVELGWRGTRLVHCSMGKDDPETAHARAMAEKLGLSFSTIEYSPERVLPVFDELLETYSLPFSDYSILPTWLVSKHVAETFGDRPLALDGTAADASFGFFDGLGLWRRFYWLPGPLRQVGARAYGWTRAWRRPGQLDALLRKFKRSAGRPDFAANLFVHPMRDIGFHAPPAPTKELLEAISSYWVRALPSDADLSFCMLDIVHQCAGVLAQKNRSVFDASPIGIAYPFLEPNLIRLALNRARFWPGTKEKKAGLKRLLARQVPHAMVYRKKSGFVIPQERTFSRPELLARLDALLDDQTHLVAQWTDRRILEELRKTLAAERTLAVYTYAFVWALLIAHGWITHAERRARTFYSQREPARGPYTSESSADLADRHQDR